MLRHIYIQDFAIIDKLDLELDSGMCVLSGETGAGKSILIDALSMVLGSRANQEVIRHGAKKADISLEFNIENNQKALERLDNHDMREDNQCVLRRVIRSDGRSKSYVNNIPTSLKIVASIGEVLVDLHGQHEHQLLLKSGQQRLLVDTIADNQTILKKIENIYHAWVELKTRVDELLIKKDEYSKRVDWLKFQVNELSQLDITDAELSDLEIQHKKLSNSQELKENAHVLLHSLYDDEERSIYKQLSESISRLQHINNIDKTISTNLDIGQSIENSLHELVQGIRKYTETLETDPKKLERLNERITSIHDIARKHNVKPEELNDVLKKLAKELKQIDSPEFNADLMQKKCDDLKNEYLKLAHKLSKKRQETAQYLNKNVSDALQDLGMEGSEFQVAIEEINDQKLTSFGVDHIKFLVKTNQGSPYRPLSSIISGGELSRVSLAIQVISKLDRTTPTMIFDEVDAGIGGATAEIVGRNLRELAAKAQVLCVTHLPQVASLAHHHIQVSKSGSNAKTSIKKLSEKERVEEISRMLGGMKLTEKTRSHAEEMIKQGQTLQEI